MIWRGGGIVFMIVPDWNYPTATKAPREAWGPVAFLESLGYLQNCGHWNKACNIYLQMALDAHVTDHRLNRPSSYAPGVTEMHITHIVQVYRHVQILKKFSRIFILCSYVALVFKV